MLNKVAKKLSIETGYPEDILLYSLSILSNTLVGYGALLSTAFVFGWFKIALILALTYSAFRTLTGGIHGSTSLRCIFTTTIALNLLSFFVNMLQFYTINLRVIIPVVLFMSAIVFYLYAPAEVSEKPINGDKQRLILKFLAFGLLIIWSFISWYLVETNYKLVLASLAGLIWQSITLTPLAFWLNTKLEKILNNFFRR